MSRRKRERAIECFSTLETQVVARYLIENDRHRAHWIRLMKEEVLLAQRDERAEYWDGLSMSDIVAVELERHVYNWVLEAAGEMNSEIADALVDVALRRVRLGELARFIMREVGNE